jgi:hypothetical protein
MRTKSPEVAAGFPLPIYCNYECIPTPLCCRIVRFLNMSPFSTELLLGRNQKKKYLNNIAYKVGQLLIKLDLLLIFLDLLTSCFVLKWEPVCLILHTITNTKFHPSISLDHNHEPYRYIYSILSRQQSHSIHTCGGVILKKESSSISNSFLMALQMTDYMQLKFLVTMRLLLTSLLH